jgi:kumamolisin
MKSYKVFVPRTETALTPMQVAACYNFPQIPIVTKRAVAILELGGVFQLSDIAAYCKSNNIAMPQITTISVDSALEQSSNADGEVGLDICVIAGAAPGVHIYVVFAPNTNQGFIDGIAKCLSLNPDAISISWGSPEDQWDAPSTESLDALFKQAEEQGINIFVAAGDNGSGDGEGGKHVDYPGSSPYVISCGGTSLQLNPNGTRLSETVWSTSLFSSEGTGGGISSTYPTPADWQTNILPSQPAGRRVPDISGNADPNTGYLVMIDGQIQQVGGTSAVAPLYAALQCLLNASKDQHIGNMHTKLYSNPGCFFDVVSGTNGAYNAELGFDLCTGLGVIDGTAFLEAL